MDLFLCETEVVLAARSVVLAQGTAVSRGPPDIALRSRQYCWLQKYRLGRMSRLEWKRRCCLDWQRRRWLRFLNCFPAWVTGRVADLFRIWIWDPGGCLSQSPKVFVFVGIGGPWVINKLGHNMEFVPFESQ